MPESFGQVVRWLEVVMPWSIIKLFRMQCCGDYVDSVRIGTIPNAIFCVKVSHHCIIFKHNPVSMCICVHIGTHSIRWTAVDICTWVNIYIPHKKNGSSYISIPKSGQSFCRMSEDLNSSPPSAAYIIASFNRISIGLDNGLLPNRNRCQAII